MQGERDGDDVRDVGDAGTGYGAEKGNNVRINEFAPGQKRTKNSVISRVPENHTPALLTK